MVMDLLTVMWWPTKEPFRFDVPAIDACSASPIAQTSIEYPRPAMPSRQAIETAIGDLAQQTDDGGSSNYHRMSPVLSASCGSNQNSALPVNDALPETCGTTAS